MFGDTPQRSYASKLDLFNRFAEKEIRQIIIGLTIQPGEVLMDAGCGSGLMSNWLAEQVQPDGFVVGVDLSTAHLQHAQDRISRSALPARFVQGDLLYPPIKSQRLDWIWCSNTLHHLHHPVDGIKALAETLRPNGRLVIGQSAFLPEMFFAWNARLENEVLQACRRYYRDKYGLDERDTTAIRNMVGWLKQAGLKRIRAQTTIIERIAPLSIEEETYFDAYFKGYWDHRVKPYLSPEDWMELEQLCDPDSPRYCLKRPDFHHIQTFSVAIGEK